MKEKPTILVVDDEHHNRSLMHDFLTPLGYEVILASDGEQALIRVEEIPPDVILLDIMMPNVDGFEVARELKKEVMPSDDHCTYSKKGDGAIQLDPQDV
jgi:CheY-like chemotaxis protein